MMNLDLRTMMVMIAVLSFLLALLLGLASLHDRGIRGLKHWAAASLFCSVGFSIAYTQQEPGNPWLIALGAVLLTSASSLQWLGIQIFTDRPRQWYVLLVSVLLVGCQSIWFGVVQSDINARALSNSLVLMCLNFACAKSLLIAIKPPERTAYWLTGASFALLAAMYAARIVSILLNPSEIFGLYKALMINPVMFFIGSVTQLFLSFGFVLMVNYRLASELESLALLDSLTGAWNRRSLEQELPRLIAHSLRNNETLSVLMLDVDYFKTINDEYGHPAGDEVLKQLIVNAKAQIRQDDYLARYGGEEFCVLLAATTADKASNLAERLRGFHETHPVFWNGMKIKSSISIGVACSEQVGLNQLELLKAADFALYRAKESGRNTVIVHGGELSQNQ